MNIDSIMEIDEEEIEYIPLDLKFIEYRIIDTEVSAYVFWSPSMQKEYYSYDM